MWTPEGIESACAVLTTGECLSPPRILGSKILPLEMHPLYCVLLLAAMVFFFLNSNISGELIKHNMYALVRILFLA